MERFENGDMVVDVTEKRRQIAEFVRAMPDGSLDEVLETLEGIREFWDWRATLRFMRPPGMRRGTMTIGLKQERPDMIAEE